MKAIKNQARAFGQRRNNPFCGVGCYGAFCFAWPGDSGRETDGYETTQALQARRVQGADTGGLVPEA